MIEDRHKRITEEIKNNIYERIHKEKLAYSRSLDRLMIKQKEDELLRKERAFKKYQNFVSNKFIILLIIVFYYER